jgi:hypothetical protein
MIRNVTLMRFKEGTSPDRIDELAVAMRGLRIDGMRELTMGRDVGLRDSNMDWAVVADFDDVEAYRAYDSDAEHNRIRRELVGPIAERIERCQFEL